MIFNDSVSFCETILHEYNNRIFRGSELEKKDTTKFVVFFRVFIAFV